MQIYRVIFPIIVHRYLTRVLFKSSPTSAFFLVLSLPYVSLFSFVTLLVYKRVLLVIFCRYIPAIYLPDFYDSYCRDFFLFFYISRLFYLLFILFSISLPIIRFLCMYYFLLWFWRWAASLLPRNRL